MTALLIGCLEFPSTMGFKKVLIANRGEIALRIMRTLRDMGIEAAIIYGKEDRLSLPVQLADDATFRDVINPLDAYLDIEAVVQAAKDMGCVRSNMSAHFFEIDHGNRAGQSVEFRQPVGEAQVAHATAIVAAGLEAGRAAGD